MANRRFRPLARPARGTQKSVQKKRAPKAPAKSKRKPQPAQPDGCPCSKRPLIDTSLPWGGGFTIYK